MTQGRRQYSECSDMRDYAANFIIVQPCFPRGHGRDLSHVGAPLLDDQNEIVIGDLAHVFLLRQSGDDRTESAAVSLAPVTPGTVASGAHLLEDFLTLGRVGLCRGR